jgi:hypothetical protein
MEDSCHDRVATKRWVGTGAEDSMSASPQIAEQSSASYRRDHDLAEEGSSSSITAGCGAVTSVPGMLLPVKGDGKAHLA